MGRQNHAGVKLIQISRYKWDGKAQVVMASRCLSLNWVRLL